MLTNRRHERTTCIPVHDGCLPVILLVSTIFALALLIRMCAPPMIDEFPPPTRSQLGPKHAHPKGLVTMGFASANLPGTPLLPLGDF